jgi:quercetin 2,3-dioxygenase
MLTLRRASDRGHFDFGWLNTFHTFSFGEYHDPAHMGFRSLRVINEDFVQPAKGFGTHGHKDMEILTWVLEGALEHKDSLGTGSTIRPGEAQIMSAGSGIRHSEFNASDHQKVHLLQIWILPEAKDLAPRYEQVNFEDVELRNRFRVIASRDAREGSVRVYQDVSIFATRLDAGVEASAPLGAARHGWLHVARGRVEANGQGLNAGDALAISDETKLSVLAKEPSEILFFDLA